MGRIPCCEKDNVKRGQWTPEEDNKLSSYIAQHGTRNWRHIPKTAGLQRCGKSCRLRWTNYLRPDLRHGEFDPSEEQMIVKLHSVVGNRWSLIAAQLLGRTDNDVKNHWNTKLKKKLSGMGIDPVTHKPFSHLMEEIATALPPPQVAHLAEAALGCFKDEMLHLLTKKRLDFSNSGIIQQATAVAGAGDGSVGAGAGMGYHQMMNSMDDDDDKEETIQKLKPGLSRAIMQEPGLDKGWGSDGLAAMCNDMYQNMGDAFRSYGNDGEGSAWSQSMCTGSTCTVGHGVAAEQRGIVLHDKNVNDNGDEAEGSDCVLWDLSDDLMNLTT